MAFRLVLGRSFFARGFLLVVDPGFFVLLFLFCGFLITVGRTVLHLEDQLGTKTSVTFVQYLHRSAVNNRGSLFKFLAPM